MRFLFRGFLKHNAEPVEGHVEADDSEAAYAILGQNGIITETLREDQKPLNLAPTPSAIPQFADALDSALDSSSSQIPFDDLTERYRGKKVWVIDRDKIRHRVAQVVDSTLAASEEDLESGATARQRVANAISGLFHDTRNIASEHNAESIAGMRLANKMAGMAANNPASMSPDSLAQQIGRLTDVVQQAEGLIGAMQAALRNVENAATATPRRHQMMAVKPSAGPTQNEVLREIFESNLDLRRAMAEAAQPAARLAAAG